MAPRMPSFSATQRALSLCQSKLQARGLAGAQTLAWLGGEGGCGVSSSMLERLEEAASRCERVGQQRLDASKILQKEAEIERAYFRTEGVLCDVVAPQGVWALGDLHGRWDVALEALQAAGLIDSGGHWIAPAGSLLVQMGDLIDADLEHLSPPKTDPDGEQLIARFAALLQSSFLASNSKAQARLFEAQHPPQSWSPSRARRARLLVTGAALNWHTLRGFMRLQGEAKAAGSLVVVLMGNHELDLLSGRCWWMKAQKEVWLELEGVSASFPHTSSLQPFLSASGDRAGLASILQKNPPFAWLSSLPLMLRAGPLLFTHGGPTRPLTEALERAEIRDFNALSSWLQTQSSVPWSAPFFAEGEALTAPSRARDNIAEALEIVRPWLEATDTDLLAVGHSPFLSLPAGEWINAKDPEMQVRLGLVERLGEAGQLLKLDTNLKRSSDWELLRFRGGDAGCLEAFGAHNPRSLLKTGETLDTLTSAHEVLHFAHEIVCIVDAHRGPELIDLEEIGLDSDDFSTLMDLRGQLEAQMDSETKVKLGAGIGWLLQASPSNLEPIFASWRRSLDLDDANGALRHLKQSRRALETRARALGRSLGQRDEDLARFSVDPRSSTFAGVRYGLVLPTLLAFGEALKAAGEALRPAIVLDLISHRGRPAARLRDFPAGRKVPLQERIHPFPEDLPNTWEGLERFANGLLEDASPHSRIYNPPLAQRGEQLLPAPTLEAFDPSKHWGSEREPLRVPRRLLLSLFEHNTERWSAITKRRGRGAMKRRSENDGERVDLAWSPLLEDCVNVALTEDAADFTPGWFALRAPWRVRVVVTPQGDLLWGDTTFSDPAASFNALPGGFLDGDDTIEHSQLLLRRWDPPVEIRLFSNLKEDVVKILIADELDQLRGIGAQHKQVWRRDAYLFAAPIAETARYFEGVNTCSEEFRVGRSELEEWMELGWVSLNLMISDAETSLNPSAFWGSKDIVLEVIASGEEGVRALWRRRLGSSKKKP